MHSAPSLPPSCYASITVWAVGWVSAGIWIKINFLSPLLGCWHIMHLCRPLHEQPQGPYQVTVAVTWSSCSWHCSWKKCSCSHGIPPLCLFSLMVKWEQPDFSVYRSALRVNVSKQQLSNQEAAVPLRKHKMYQVGMEKAQDNFMCPLPPLLSLSLFDTLQLFLFIPKSIPFVHSLCKGAEENWHWGELCWNLEGRITMWVIFMSDTAWLYFRRLRQLWVGLQEFGINQQADVYARVKGCKRVGNEDNVRERGNYRLLQQRKKVGLQLKEMQYLRS